VQIAGYLRRFCCGRNAHVIPFRVPLMWRGVSPKKRLYARESEDPTEVDQKAGLPGNPLGSLSDKRCRFVAPLSPTEAQRKTAPQNGAVIAKWSGK
jgi:hypothetical protein